MQEDLQQVANRCNPESLEQATASDTQHGRHYIPGEHEAQEKSDSARFVSSEIALKVLLDLHAPDGMDFLSFNRGYTKLKH